MGKPLSVVLWSKEGCSYCDEVKQFFKENKIQYQTIDVTNHDDRRDILETKYNIRHVPIVEIGNGSVYTAVTDVGIEYLRDALKEHTKLRS